MQDMRTNPVTTYTACPGRDAFALRRLSGYVYVKRFDGHRQSYQSLLSRLMHLEEMAGPLTPGRLLTLLRSPRVLFSTIDDSYLGFFVVAILRAALGRRTTGLFLRPSQCFQTTRYYHRVKRLAFNLLRRIPPISVLTIAPFALRPEFRQVATGWVHDPQMWDLTTQPGALAVTPMSDRIRAEARGRQILCFVGAVTAIKGVHLLSDLFQVRPDLSDRVLVVLAGKVDSDCREAVERLAAQGALVINRRVSDDEIESLYGASDLIWACYRPDYDQASGIFGRAIQTGRCPVVRSGSLIEGYADLLGRSVLPLPYDDAGKAAEALDRTLAETPRHLDACLTDGVAEWRDHFERTLAGCL